MFSYLEDVKVINAINPSFRRDYELQDEEDAADFFQPSVAPPFNPFEVENQPVLIRFYRSEEEADNGEALASFYRESKHERPTFIKAILARHKASFPAHTLYAVSDELEAIGFFPMMPEVFSAQRKLANSVLVQVFIDSSQMATTVYDESKLSHREVDDF